MKEIDLIYEFRKNSMEKVAIQFGEFNGIKVINLRVFYLVDAFDSEWRPCSKGIMMDIKNIPELKKGIDKAYEKWRKSSKPHP